jgi:alanine-synthesizing transaminase
MFSDRTGWNLERNKLSEALAKRRSSGLPLIDLMQSNPTQCGFHFDAQKILAALNNPASLQYDPDPQGLPHAREAVAAYHRSRNCQISIDDIFLTTSTSEAYSFLFRMLCNPGDELLIPQPGYPLFNFLAEIQDVSLVRYPLVYDYGWQIDFHSLQQAITSRTRGIIVVHPNNPTGHFCKPGEIERLNQICRERYIAIISDEVFLDFSLAPNAPPTFASNNEVLTFTMSGLSKISGLPQMKVAWLTVAGATALKQQAIGRLEMIADTYLSMNTPIQLALPVLLEQRRQFRKQWLTREQDNLAYLDRLLESQKLCSRLKMEGGWYAVMKAPSVMGDDEVALELLTTRGVYVHPGHFYDFPSDGYWVVSLITPEREFAEGIDALLAMFVAS